MGRALALLAAVGASCVPALAGDVVTDWNTMWRDVVRIDGGGPTYHSRAQAMFNVAMHDAVQSIQGQYHTYMPRATTPQWTSPEAAASKAAHRVLCELYPTHTAAFDGMLASHMNAIPNGGPKDEGIALGQSVASGMMSMRAGDGWNNATPYVPTPGVGHWRPDPPAFGGPHAPNWGNVTPWTMSSGSQFRPSSIGGYTSMTDLLASSEYAGWYNEVKSLGARNSATRTAEQTEIARFWANDADGTYKPPGHLNRITQIVAEQQGLTMSEKARLFALVSLGMADAGVAAWDAKYNSDLDLWRPTTGIHEGDADGNAATAADPTWEPLLEFVPGFPAWVSGHATFGGAHAAVMRGYFGTDNITFTADTDDPFAVGVTRTFDSFTEAAWENAISRVYLGVHWRVDGVDGNMMGLALGDQAVANYLTLVPSPGGAAVLGAAGVLAMRRRRV